MTLEQVFVTHRDLDHSGGIPDVLRRHGAKQLHLNFGWSLPADRHAKTRVKAVLSSILSIVEEAAIELLHGYTGDNGTFGTMRWELLAPDITELGRASLAGSINGGSMIVLIESNGCRVLVTGDADQRALERLLTNDTSMRADVVLLPHHGAHITGLDEFLRSIQPSIIVISAGRTNAYGHPTLSTLNSAVSGPAVYVACTQVTYHCHTPSLDPPACAGTVTVELLEPRPQVVDASVHAARKAQLETPVCVR